MSSPNTSPPQETRRRFDVSCGKPTMTDRPPLDLANYRPGDDTPGRGVAARGLWYLTSLMVFESGWFPFRQMKPLLLRLFGATVGTGVVIKPHVRIKFPWRLTLGSHVWLGQDVWIDNLAPVEIGDDCCLSQGVYLCTGSHDRNRATFDLITQPIVIESGCWICARAMILPGVSVGSGAVVAAGSVVLRDVPPNATVGGQPARDLRRDSGKNEENPEET
jgi:putative colanic acid biosynthesis acetyltransferase WcaF